MTNVRAAASLGVGGQGASDSREVAPKSVSDLLVQLKPQIEMALPKHMTADRMLRIILTEMRRVPRLAQCEVKSLFGAVIQCAQLGLEPGGALGHVYLIPFENKKKGIIEAQLMLGYRGMIDLTYRSGMVNQIYAFPVHAKDQFRYALGLNPILEHVPYWDDVPGDLIGAYAVAKTTGEGAPLFEYMTRRQIDGIRARSRSRNEGPWVTDFDEMARKTAVRRLWKYLPVSIEMQATIARAINLDNAVDLGLSQHNEGLIEGTSTEIQPSPDDQPPPDQPDDPGAASLGGMTKEEADKRAAATE